MTRHLSDILFILDLHLENVNKQTFGTFRYIKKGYCKYLKVPNDHYVSYINTLNKNRLY